MRPLQRFVFLSCLSALIATAGEIGPFAGPEADAEAARLYERADDYIRDVKEGPYSYSYIQFHWKLASSNIDRILRAYPDSPTAKQLAAGELEVGPFTPTYLKERVLPRLEEKKVATFDAVNCAIFLYTEDFNTSETGKKRLLEEILLTLCRQTRWGEALAFPVLDDERAWLWNIVIRQAVTYRNDDLADELLANALGENRRLLLNTKAKALGFRGETSEAFEEFLADNKEYEPELRLAILQGLVRRQKHIDRAIQLNRPLKGLYDGVDGVQLAPDDVSYADLSEFYNAFGLTRPPEAKAAYAEYLAFLGRFAEAGALAPQSAWVDAALNWLIDQEQYAEAVKLGSEYPDKNTKLVQLLASAGRMVECNKLIGKHGNDEKLIFARTRGQLLSTTQTFMVREHTFSDLPIQDPNLIGRLICEWSLTPNRALRGAAPWDAIVYKFAPGFENLPLPEDKDKIEAAGR